MGKMAMLQPLLSYHGVDVRWMKKEKKANNTHRNDKQVVWQQSAVITLQLRQLVAVVVVAVSRWCEWAAAPGVGGQQGHAVAEGLSVTVVVLL
jgi:hypothetical protein